MNAQNQNSDPPITRQTVGGVLKSARDIVRKDKGFTGDLGGLPMLERLQAETASEARAALGAILAPSLRGEP
ncbi:MAG TPA: hypothetical protein VNZ64_08850 [Candidatus Acidoferrum sp.]|nr:hypothetical protein [Candidatus Acidoferrum sp.]